MRNFLLLFVCLAGCAAPLPPRLDPPPKLDVLPIAEPPQVEEGQPLPGYKVVRAFFATDRQISSAESNNIYSAQRGALTYGLSEVSIPNLHQKGNLEAPSFLRDTNPERHITLLNASILERQKFLSDLARRVLQTSHQSLFLFVHGYNVSFRDVAQVSAQFAFDLNLDGALVYYSWPSQAKTASYTVDEQNSEWSQSNFKSVLEDVLSQSGAQRVYLMAHSMGNRVLIRALVDLLNQKPQLAKNIKEVILAAPDIDAGVFRRDLAPALIRNSLRVTLYASAEDLALKASHSVHGYSRAGDAGGDLVVLPGIETIDVTGVDGSMLGHSYFTQTRILLADLYNLVSNDQRAGERFGLREEKKDNISYWKFVR